MADVISNIGQVPLSGRFISWLQGPTSAIYATYFLSSWGDRMWHFAVGLYLVFFDDNKLRLAAIYGFISSGCILLLGGVIGNWVDTNRRIKVVRIALLFQNLSVALSAAGIVVLLVIDKAVPIVVFNLLATAVMILGVLAMLASCAFKISIEKDWIVVVASGDSSTLADLNAVTRTVDLLCKALSPMLVGQVMTYGSRLMGAVIITAWNLFSVFAEYALLVRIYRLVPSLAHKQDVDQPVDTTQSQERFLKESSEAGRIKLEPIVSDELKVALSSDRRDIIGSDVKEEDEDLGPEALQIRTAREDGAKLSTGVRLVFTPCFRLVINWGVYIRQPVLLAGLSLACLYMTVLGFDSITIGYIFSQGVSESILGICCMLSALTGIIGTFLYTRSQRLFGLHTTGITSLCLEVAFLVFSLISIWTPGSPFYLYNGHVGLADCQPTGRLAQRPDVLNMSLSSGLLASRPAPSRQQGLEDVSLVLNTSLREGAPALSSLALNSRSELSRRESRDVADNGTVTRHALVDSTTAVTPYGVKDDSVDGDAEPTQCDSEDTPKTSVILFLVGIIGSRVGLWMADLTVTHMYQEQVVEHERGVVGGVQSSLNMMLDMLKFVAVILLPEINTFGFLVIMSFLFIVLGLGLFTTHVIRVNHNKGALSDDVFQKNVIYIPKQGVAKV